MKDLVFHQILFQGYSCQLPMAGFMFRFGLPLYIVTLEVVSRLKSFSRQKGCEFFLVGLSWYSNSDQLGKQETFYQYG